MHEHENKGRLVSYSNDAMLAARTSDSVRHSSSSWFSMANASAAWSAGRKASKSSRSIWLLHQKHPSLQVKLVGWVRLCSHWMSFSTLVHDFERLLHFLLNPTQQTARKDLRRCSLAVFW